MQAVRIANTGGHDTGMSGEMLISCAFAPDMNASIFLDSDQDKGSVDKVEPSTSNTIHVCVQEGACQGVHQVGCLRR